MAKSTAERQAAYRQKRATAGENGDRRINTWAASGAVLALSRLSHRYGVTQREMLERLLTSADQEIVSALEPDTEEWRLYFNVTQ